MLRDVLCLCGAEFAGVNLEETDGWFTCPICGCTTKPCVRRIPLRIRRKMEEFSLESLVTAVKEKRI